MGRRLIQIWYTDYMLWQKIHHWFIPHKDTHKKAHLISWEALFGYIFIFILLQVSFSIIGFAKPGVLGISANINQITLIELTNQERAKNGLEPVAENEALNRAAAMKAQNMLEENYWAHFAPSGKSPWDFILGAGYRFSFAGENLAKNFYNSGDVVEAWMASPTHRDNILNSKYKDIGIAVVEGNLNGQMTTLVVQEFGTTDIVTTAQAQAPPQAEVPVAEVQPTVTVQGKQIVVQEEEYENKPTLIAASVNPPPLSRPLIDPYMVSKTAGISVLSVIAVLLFVDFLVLRRRGVFRLSSNHIAHMVLLSLAGGTLIYGGPGSIL